MPTRPLLCMPDVLLHLLRLYPDGVRAVELRNVLQPRPPAKTVHSALRLLCHQGLVVRVGYGRYALTSVYRTLPREV